MTPTIFVVRIDGHGTEHLSLHANERRADEAFREAARVAWVDRFGYSPPEEPTPILVERLAIEGFRASVGPVEVEL